jgi:hypothetical protein
MKKLFIFATVLLLLGGAMPHANAQFTKTFKLKDYASNLDCNFVHPLHDIKTVFVDVCSKPEKKWSSPFEFIPPTLKFSREAMIFNTVNFVISSYDKDIDNNLREWDLQIDFDNGNGFSTIPSSGGSYTVTYALGSKPIIKYKAWVRQNNPLSNDNKFSDEKEKEFFIKTPTNPDYQNPDKIWKFLATII